jgi:hypothetical protein
MPMTDEELRGRAELIERVIRTRAKLQEVRDRAETLQAALERFKQRRAAMKM